MSGDINGDDVNVAGNFTNKTDNAYHVLTADGVTGPVVIDGFTVIGGYAVGPDAGTAVKTTFTSVITSITYAHDAGGVLIARHGSQVSINNVQFELNASDATNATLLSFDAPNVPLIGGGGALAAMDSGTMVSITNSSLANNAALAFGNSGGAISATFGSSVSASSSLFSSNQAIHLGGAIKARQDATISLNSNNFSNNQIIGNLAGDESGGAIGIFNATASILNSTFTSNSTFTASTVNTTFGGGGAVFFHTPFDNGHPYNLAITNCIFTNNQGSSIGGGAILAFDGLANAGTSVSILNSIFTQNTAGIGGGTNGVDFVTDGSFHVTL